VQTSQPRGGQRHAIRPLLQYKALKGTADLLVQKILFLPHNGGKASQGVNHLRIKVLLQQW
jgi:hypothetical protein